MTFFLPCREVSAQAIKLYVDETYFEYQTGFIQVALPVPGPPYETSLAEDLRQFLPGRGESRQLNYEFKASKLNGRNETRYTRFLEFLLRDLRNVHDESSITPVVTFESMQNYAKNDPDYSWVREQTLALSIALQMNVDTHLTEEFSKQVLWLWRTSKAIFHRPIGNPIALVFDNKHNYATLVNKMKSVALANGLIVFDELRRQFARMATCILNEMQPKKSLPPLQDFAFEFSEKTVFLQASDVLCNLIHNALKFHKGIANENTARKCNVLSKVIPNLQFDEKLLSAFEVAGENVVCRKSDLYWCQYLSPI